MTLRMKLAVLATLASALPAWGQVPPVPIVGGDLIPPLIHQFLPGTGAGLDGLNAEPNGITNYRGSVALAYTQGSATDNTGFNYAAGTDIRRVRGRRWHPCARHLRRNMN